MRKKILYSALSLVVLLSAPVQAQEVLSDLGGNPVIKEYLRTHPAASRKARTQAPGDTLHLPLSDDFSREGIYPDQGLWLDSNVYINDDYPQNAITIGVATFDGTDQHGSPRNPFSPSAQGIADSLTSRPVNLFDYIDPSDNLLKTYKPSDSVFISFYYQAQGLGNRPEPEDSLLLQFRVPGKSWRTVRRFTADTLRTDFRKAELLITDTAFLKKGFQFRFVNYATLSGSLDHWHIDYVYLNRRLSLNRYLNDVAFVKRQKSMLKDIQSKPWSHYSPSDRETGFSISMRNLSSPQSQPNLTFYDYGIYSPYVSTQSNTPQVPPNSVFTNTYNFPFDFTPSGSTDDIGFEIKHIINPSPDVNLSNDTLRYVQRFANYFAYDDGTAENGYGINANLGKIAYRFTLSHPDSLRAVGIFFTQLIDNLSGRAFRFKVWTSLSPEDSIYTSETQFLTYEKGINQFYLYRLSKAVPVSGTIYVGMEQYTEDILNIGFDRNTNAQQNLFYNTGSGWYSSQKAGSIMLRPYVGKPVPLSIGEQPVASPLRFYPNPASGSITIPGILDISGVRVEVVDLLGRTYFSEIPVSERISIEALEQGIYFVRVHNAQGRAMTAKLVVSR
jgi:hypothetical protein